MIFIFLELVLENKYTRRSGFIIHRGSCHVNLIRRLSMLLFHPSPQTRFANHPPTMRVLDLVKVFSPQSATAVFIPLLRTNPAV